VTAARYLCMVCCRSLSAAPGVCARCGVDRLDLLQSNVRDEVIAESERRLQTRAYREYFWIAVGTFVVTSPIYLWSLLIWLIVAASLGLSLTQVYARFNPRSATARLNDRKRRLLGELGPAAELTGDPAGRVSPAAPAPSPVERVAVVGGDVELESALGLLGARID
jgi:hypothetical protein